MLLNDHDIQVCEREREKKREKVVSGFGVEREMGRYGFKRHVPVGCKTFKFKFKFTHPCAHLLL